MRCKKTTDVWWHFWVRTEAYFFNCALMSFYAHSLDDMLPDLDAACLGLVVVGIVFGIAVFIQNSLFTFMQDTLRATYRLDTVCLSSLVERFGAEAEWMT